MNNRGVMILSSVAIILSLIGIFYPKEQKFGVIDMNFIVSEQAKIMAKNNPQANFSVQQIKQVTDRIKDQVGAFCHQNHIILISKGAVFGETLKDYTDQVYETLILNGEQE